MSNFFTKKRIKNELKMIQEFFRQEKELLSPFFNVYHSPDGVTVVSPYGVPPDVTILHIVKDLSPKYVTFFMQARMDSTKKKKANVILVGFVDFLEKFFRVFVIPFKRKWHKKVVFEKPFEFDRVVYGAFHQAISEIFSSYQPPSEPNTYI